MAIWHNSEMTIYSSSGEPYTDECEVRIDGSEIVVSYKENDSHRVWKGDETESGHYRLKLSGTSDTATLHRFDNHHALEGYWEEDGDDGMWRILLDEQ